MPAFSGLYDGIHKTPYALAAVPKPAVSGLVRVLMQKRGMFGHVDALGRNTIATRKQVQTDRSDQSVPGTFSYPARTTARDVTITNVGDDVNTLEDAAVVGTAAAADLVQYDTVLNKEYAADAANSGVTAPALAQRNPT